MLLRCFIISVINTNQLSSVVYMAVNPKTQSNLKQENAKLRKQVKQLKHQLNKDTPLEHKNSWLSIIKWTCVSVAGALLVASNLLVWAGRTVVDTNQYIKTVGPLIKQPAIQGAIAERFTNRVFETVDVAEVVREVLPERANFLADPLANQAKSRTKESVSMLLNNDRFQQLWINSLQISHEKMVQLAKNNASSDGVIDLSEVYSALSNELKDTKLSFLAGKQLPENIGTIKLVESSRLAMMHNLVNNFKLYRAISIFLFLLAGAGAVLASRNKRRTVITLSILSSLLMLLTLVSLRTSQHLLIEQNIQPVYQQAVREASDTIISPLVKQTWALLIFGILIGLIAWIGSKSAKASALKNKFSQLLSGNVHRAIFTKGENSFTRFVGQNRTSISGIFVGLFFITMLVGQISIYKLLVYFILLVLAELIVWVLSPIKK